MTKTCPICLFEMDGSAGACPQCGFKFLGSTQEFKPIVFETEKKDRDSAPAVLKVVRGPQVGAIYKLDSDSVSLGRNPQCDIFLNDMTVSRTHAEIYREGDTFVIKDVDSFNGVWVNNQNVELKTLKSGDFIQIGKFAFVFDDEL